LRSIECADGYILRYRTWSPAGAPHATFVLLNGVMSHSGWFQPLADHVVARGVKLVGADRRGTGLNERARGDAPSAAMVIDDVLRIIDAERLDGLPVHLAGWCWGAVLAVNVAAAREGDLASLVLLTPGLYPSEAVTLAIKNHDVLARSPTGAAYLDVSIPEEMFTRGSYLAFIADDELRGREVSVRFHRIMRKLAMGAGLRIGKLELPILLVLAQADEATDNARTRQEFELLNRSQVTIEVIDGAHGLQFENPAKLAHVLAAWTEAVRPKAGAECEN
jgi:alpha-beta hydrolase superfamily lysophospholipase